MNVNVWSADKSTKVENQEKAFFPLNPMTEYLYYIHPQSHNNQRMIISALTKCPIVWQISKVENHAPKGIQKVTFYQTKFNDETDFVNFETGEMYADYYQSSVAPLTDKNDNYLCDISTSTNSIKIGGGYKTLTATLHDENNAVSGTDYNNAVWKFFIDEIDITNSDLIKIIYTDSPNKIKIKFAGDKSYIQKELKITCSFGNIIGKVSLIINAM